MRRAVWDRAVTPSPHLAVGTHGVRGAAEQVDEHLRDLELVARHGRSSAR
jgi:hypothetical protein